jgi:GLPGLI family protein
MKKIVLVLCLLFANFFVKAQEFQGVAYYASQTQMKNFSISSNDITPSMKEEMMAKMKKAFEKTFILTFTKTESLYHEEEKLEVPNPSNGGVQVTFSNGGSTKLYKNLKLQNYSTNQDIFGKEFLIEDVLEQFDWKLLNEQKVIGDYNCSKAQIIIPVSANDLKEYQDFKEKQEKNKTAFFSLSEPKERVIEAWYSTNIPVSNGPEKYWGLPGLILELHDGSTTLLCSKIILNPKEKTEIKAPKNGKRVSQKEFEKIEEKKLKSMMNEEGVIEIRTN